MTRKPSIPNQRPMSDPALADEWRRLGATPTVGTMLLNESHEAAAIEVEDRREVLTLPPPLAGLSMLEIGAGIGRFTRHFTALAAAVVAVDLVPGFIAENRRRNGRRPGDSFLCADIATLDFMPASFDFVFSNWLLMYLDDALAADLIIRARRWLRPGGHLFLRESCLRPSIGAAIARPAKHRGIIARTRYRAPEAYEALIEPGFEIVREGFIGTYLRHYDNANQRYWLLRKRGS